MCLNSRFPAQRRHKIGLPEQIFIYSLYQRISKIKMGDKRNRLFESFLLQKRLKLSFMAVVYRRMFLFVRSHDNARRYRLQLFLIR